MRSSSSYSAFSLIELLVAVTVATVVIGSALLLILHSFGVWGQGLAQAGELRATDDFDADFDRDFASACPSLGLQGTASACTFWTLQPGAENIKLSRVRYAIGEAGIVAERWTFGDDLEKPGLVSHYPAQAFVAFSYAGGNITDELWQTTWDCKTNMPQAISIHCAKRSELPERRLYLHSSLEPVNR